LQTHKVFSLGGGTISQRLLRHIGLMMLSTEKYTQQIH